MVVCRFHEEVFGTAEVMHGFTALAGRQLDVPGIMLAKLRRNSVLTTADGLSVGAAIAFQAGTGADGWYNPPTLISTEATLAPVCQVTTIGRLIQNIAHPMSDDAGSSFESTKSPECFNPPSALIVF
ncbi:MAG: hypothetical protein OXL68_10020 [Paracoccaceae bacterium]|nr:hypothetical protein [Paracoccaceae bacterium]